MTLLLVEYAEYILVHIRNQDKETAWLACAFNVYSGRYFIIFFNLFSENVH